MTEIEYIIYIETVYVYIHTHNDMRIEQIYVLNLGQGRVLAYYQPRLNILFAIETTECLDPRISMTAYAFFLLT